jgi:hypothetical protein
MEKLIIGFVLGFVEGFIVLSWLHSRQELNLAVKKGRK